VARVPEGSIRRRRIVAALVVGAIIVGLGSWAITYTPLFRARHIRVVGAETLRAEAVRSLAGVDATTNVWHLDTDRTVALLMGDPWIASASVHRELPSTLVLEIVERRPLAVISAMGETSILASDGSALPGPVDDGRRLPTMHAAVGAPDEAQRVEAADLLSALDTVVMQRVDDVTVGQDGVVTVTLRDGVLVDAGLGGEEAEKAAALRAVLRWSAIGGHELAAIDVSAPSAPSATLSDGSSVTP
jgi:cell division protein FtsQ